MKITFELSEEAAIKAALNAGCKNAEEAKLFAMEIKRRSRFKKLVKDNTQYMELMAHQNAGYIVVAIEA